MDHCGELNIIVIYKLLCRKIRNIKYMKKRNSIQFVVEQRQNNPKKLINFQVKQCNINSYFNQKGYNHFRISINGTVNII